MNSQIDRHLEGVLGRPENVQPCYLGALLDEEIRRRVGVNARPVAGLYASTEVRASIGMRV